MSVNTRVIRGRILTFKDDPAAAGSSAHIYFEDGAVRIADGFIAAVGEAREILANAPQDATVDDYSSCLVMAGFIDAHIHYPQTKVIGSYGAQLLDWLHNYTFVEEQKFAVPLRHHDGDGLLHGASAIGRCFLRRGSATRRAHDRGQDDDGSRRA